MDCLNDTAPHSHLWHKLATLSFKGQVQKQEISKSTSVPKQDSAELHRSISFPDALVQEDLFKLHSKDEHPKKPDTKRACIPDALISLYFI